MLKLLVCGQRCQKNGETLKFWHFEILKLWSLKTLETCVFSIKGIPSTPQQILPTPTLAPDHPLRVGFGVNVRVRVRGRARVGVRARARARVRARIRVTEWELECDWRGNAPRLLQVFKTLFKADVWSGGDPSLEEVGEVLGVGLASCYIHRCLQRHTI